MLYVEQFNPFTSSCIHQAELFTRVQLFAANLAQVKRANDFTRRFLARLVLGDPNFIALMLLNDETLVGHALGEIHVDEDDPTQVEVFVVQCEVDPGNPGGLDLLIRAGDNWGRERGARIMRFETNLHTSRAWQRRLGFRVTGYVMERDVIPLEQKEKV